VDVIYGYLGRRVRSRRRALGLTEDALAAATGLSRLEIERCERGLDELAASHLWRIAKALDVSIDYFYEALDLAASPVEPTIALPERAWA
jgi:transcriptional regulator with XRE-family HTH domain